MSDQTYEGTYLIIKCWKRYNDQGRHNGGWYRIFGPGGFWNVPLVDCRARQSTGDSGPPPYWVGQALTGVRLRLLDNPTAVAKRVAHVEHFSPLVPRASDVTLAEL